MLKVGEAKEKLKHAFCLVAGKRRVRRGCAAVLFLFLFSIITAFEFFPAKTNLVAGQVSPRTYKSEKSIVFEDKNKTNEQRRLAAERVEKVYTKDPQVGIAVQKDISELMGKVRGVQSEAGLDAPAKAAKIKEIIPFVLAEDELLLLAQGLPSDTSDLENKLNGLVAEAMEAGEGITPDRLEEAKRSLYTKVAAMRLARPYEELARGVIDRYLRANAFVNYEKTRQKQEEAMASVPPAMVAIKEGEKIIGEGEIVTEEHLAKLQALGLARPKLPFTSFLGVLMLVALLMAVVLFYIYRQNREIYEHSGLLYMLGIIVFLVLAVGKAIIAINVNQWPEFNTQLGYTVPVAACGMLIAILLDARLAVLVVAVVSLLLGVMTGNQLRFGLAGLIGGAAGAYSVTKLSQRSDLMRAGLYTSAANMLGIFVVGLASGTPAALTVSSSIALGLANGILSSILTNGTLPFFEHTFHLTSPVRLLELSHQNNPLLKRLLTEAPGTYHHSILVGNLAEAAADAVGGDSLLVRVGAYYHDVGKLKRPYFFIENQLSGENPHDKISPSLSTLILTSHVKDGVELAREHKLPQGIIDIIEQHHGSALVSFFYQKALENGRSETISEDEYRYEGPKPQTKEAAIVMLADSVEAAVRSMTNRTPGKVEGLVRKIIKEKLHDGQLEECDLTFKDLDKIASAFVKVLSGIFHSRIEYPDMAQMLPKKEKTGKKRGFLGANCEYGQ